MRTAVLIVGVALLAGCGGPSLDERNVSVEEVSEKVRAVSGGDSFVQPGKWISSVSIEKIDIPGMPPQAEEQMKQTMAQLHGTEICIRPEDSQRPKPEMFGGDETCRYNHFRMGGGRMDAEMRCEQEGMTQVMSMNGTYSAEAYQMRMKTTSEGGPGGAEMTMQMRVEAKRVGECTGEEA